MKKNQRNILIALVILLLLFITYKVVKGNGNGGGGGTGTDCDAREPIGCWSGCPSPSNSTFYTSSCGISDDCGDSTNYPYDVAPMCPADPSENPDDNWVVIDDGGGILDDPLDNGLAIEGCTNYVAINYDPNATVSCNNGYPNDCCSYASTNDTTVYGCCNPFDNAYMPSCPTDPNCVCTPSQCLW